MRGRTNTETKILVNGTLGTYTVVGNAISKGDFVECNGSSVQAYALTDGWKLGIAQNSGNVGDGISVIVNSI